MTARERILMIRLTQKLEKYPAFAKALGVEAAGARKHQKAESGRKDLADA